MKWLKHFNAILIFCFCIGAAAQTNEFTYQGKLTDGGASPTAPYDFVFFLCADVSSVPCIGSPIFRSGVPVTAGVFKVSLDFGASTFASDTARYLEIHVRPGGSPISYTPLAPRQPITSAPYSIKSLSAAFSDSLSSACSLCVTDAKIQSVDGGKITGTVANAVNAINAATATTAGNVTGIVPIANGGTGSATKNFVDLSTNQPNIGGDKTFSGVLSGNGAGLTNVPGTLRWQTTAEKFLDAQPNNGYLITGAAQTTIALPIAPNVGDVVRVSASGAGGWKIAPNKLQSIILVNTNLFASIWTARESSRNWSAIASSTDGERLVAAVYNGQIYVSDDAGATWEARQNTRRWTAVASSADGTRLAVASEFNTIYVSNNSGATWTPRETSRVWSGIASSADGSKLAAVASNGQIYVSGDAGETWTAREINREWRGIASSADGTKLAAAARFAGIYTSDDSGLNWTARETSRSWLAIASSADGSKLAAVEENGQIYTSTDSGATWMPRESNRNWRAIASSADGTKLAATASSGQIHVSGDGGINWSAHESSRNWSAIAASADGAKFAAAASGNRIYMSTSAATTAANQFLTGGQFSAVELQYVGNGQFLPISFVGAILLF